MGATPSSTNSAATILPHTLNTPTPTSSAARLSVSSIVANANFRRRTNSIIPGLIRLIIHTDQSQLQFNPNRCRPESCPT